MKFSNVFLDVEVNGIELGRIEIELYDDTPLTSENFRCLCTGEVMGKNGKALHYKGNIFHRIVDKFMI